MDELIEWARAGDEAACEELVHRYRGFAFRVASGFLRDDHLAEDAVQEAFAEAFGSLDRLRDPDAFGGWLRFIVRKQADRIARRRKPEVLFDEADRVVPPDLIAGSDPPPDVTVEIWERQDAVRAALRTVSGGELLRQRYLQDRTTLEIAAALGSTEGAVRKRLHDARRRLRPVVAEALGIEEDTMGELLGRVLASDGTAMDGGSDAGVIVAPDVRPEPVEGVLWTSIKAIDLLAPIVRGGTVDLRGRAGLGQLVLVSEIVVRRPDACLVVAGIAAREGLDEAGIASRSLVLLGDAAVDAARRAAQALAARHPDVLVLLDRAHVDGPPSFAGRYGASAVTVVVAGTQDAEPAEPLDGADTTIELSPALAYRGWYPAINPLRSRSRALESGAVGLRHTAAAARLREAVDLAQRLQMFLTQPFFVAEPYTELPGRTVPIGDTLAGVEQLVAGAYSELPPDAFLFIGPVDQAVGG